MRKQLIISAPRDANDPLIQSRINIFNRNPPGSEVSGFGTTISFNKENGMRLKGEVTIQSPRKRVWDFMTDPEQIGQCVPGVEKIEMI